MRRIVGQYLRSDHIHGWREHSARPPEKQKPTVVNATTLPAIKWRGIETGEFHRAFDRR
jgi:hypothetical protein